jgi:PhnB protein
MDAKDPVSENFRTIITATLSVRHGARAIEFYKKAFGAVELHHVDGDDGTVVSQLSVEGAEFCRHAVAAGATQVVAVGEGHGWRLGRIRDPFGHHWEIGRQV